MDPDATLRLIKGAIATLRFHSERGDTAAALAAADRLADHFGDLDEWMTNGGFKPGPWAGRS